MLGRLLVAAASLALTGSVLAQSGDHWAFRPTIDREPPSLGSDRARTDVDRFVLARIDAAGLAPAEPAEPASLIRRLTFDLTGLPPTPEVITEFARDRSDDAYLALVDRLLASPEYGERWGRHWLDVARFAESSGGGRSLMFKHAWRYRDYVIDSYTRDVPFDRFIREQIAGDLLPSTGDDEHNRNVTATGFLVLGPTNYEQQDKELLRMDVIDEQIDTIGRAFLGMTLGCARCHDHKFDPVPTEDYYALAGILGSTEVLTPGNVSGYVERELRGVATDAWHAHREQLAKLEVELDAARAKLGGKDARRPRRLDREKLQGIVLDDADATLIGEWKLSTHNPGFLDAGYLHDENRLKGDKSVTFTPALPADGEYEVRVSYTSGSNRATNVPVTIDGADGPRTVTLDQRRSPTRDDGFESLGRFRFAAGMTGVVRFGTLGTDGHVIVDAVQWIPANEVGEPEARPSEAVESALLRHVDELEARRSQLIAAAPPEAPRVMSVRDIDAPRDGHVHVRGGVRELGPEVPRGFLSICSETATIPERSSGRLQLADWIADPDHPLTARVYVNRVWHHLFGAGLVRTPDNFGHTGERPTHPELLDWLARRFVDTGWSTKRLIREIVLSSTYRSRVADLEGDPENRLLTHQNRRRLDAEAIRDAILSISGRLDRTRGGYTIRRFSLYDYGYEFESRRRSVYVPRFRNAELELFTVFDAANPNLVTGSRTVSNVAPQALFLMNNPWLLAHAEHAADRLLAVDDDDETLLDRAYLLTLGRTPTDAERGLSRRHLATGDRKVAWAGLFHVLLASIDFRYVD